MKSKSQGFRIETFDGPNRFLISNADEGCFIVELLPDCMHSCSCGDLSVKICKHAMIVICAMLDRGERLTEIK